MFGGIGSFFGKLFGTDQALSAVVDGVSNGLDKLIYTDEEKADAAAKDRSEARLMVIEWMRSTQGQNLARRFIALAITGVWLGMYLLSVLFSMIAVWVDDPGKLQESAAIAQTSANDMNPAVMLILAFYFAAPHMGQIASSVVEKFTGQASKPSRVG